MNTNESSVSVTNDTDQNDFLCDRVTIPIIEYPQTPLLDSTMCDQQQRLCENEFIFPNPVEDDIPIMVEESIPAIPVSSRLPDNPIQEKPIAAIPISSVKPSDLSEEKPVPAIPVSSASPRDGSIPVQSGAIEEKSVPAPSEDIMRATFSELKDMIKVY